MMEVAKTMSLKKKLTAEEYFRLEETTDERIKFFQGNIFPMGGNSKRHNEILDNIQSGLEQFNLLPGSMIHTSRIQLEVQKGNCYFYPDLILTCDKRDALDEYFVRHPMLLVEVLSEKTEDRDRVFKWQQYRKLASLQHYLMVYEHELLAELYSRSEGENYWTFRPFENMDEVVNLEGLNFSLPLRTIYENVKPVSVAAEEEE